MRRLLTILLLLFVLAAGLWTAGWYIAAQQLIAGIDRWAESRRAEGWQVSYGTPSPAGFPSKVAALLPEPVIAVPAQGESGTAWDWHAPAVRIEIVPWRLDRAALRNSGLNKVGVTRNGVHLDATLDCEDVLVRLESGRRDGGRYLVELTGARLAIAEPAIAARATQLAVDLRLFRPPPEDHQAVAADLAIGVTDLVTELFGSAGATPISANLQANLLGAIAPGPLDRSITAWRDDGGTIEVRRLSFSSAGINATANGTLALDNRMRPMGAATAAIRGYDEAIDRLTAIGSVNPRDAQLAKLLLTAIAMPGDDGTRVLTVPITGQEGWLYVGPVRLAKLDALKLK